MVTQAHKTIGSEPFNRRGIAAGARKTMRSEGFNHKENTPDGKASPYTNPHPSQAIERIAGAAYDMELHISDAIGIARTAGERQIDDDGGDCSEALNLILYRLEQTQKGHAHIAKLAPYPKSVKKAEGRPS